MNRFVDGMIDLIGEVAHTPDHPMRRELDAYLAELLVRLRDDPEMQAQAGRLKAAIVEGSELDQLAGAGWSTLKSRLAREPEDSTASAASWFSAIAAKIAQSMLDDPALIERLNLRMSEAAESVLGRFQPQFSLLITEVVQRWDAEMITEKIESELGPDLQFIRVNGSVVGGIAGVVLHAALVAGGGA